MPRCLIAYFSQAGSTAKVAEAIARGLRDHGFDVDLFSLTRGKVPQLQGYDLLGLGSPVYYYRQPFNVIDFVSGLPLLNGLPAFTFNTYATYQCDASREIIKAVMKKHGRPIGHYSCRGSGTFLGYAKLGYVFSPDHPKDTALADARAFGELMAARATTVSTVKLDLPRAAPFIYRTERFLSSRWLAAHIYSRLFKVDREKCSKCGLCEKVCPTANIRKGRSGHPVWGRRCILCQTCESKCPKDAISSALESSLFMPFIRHNVRVASNDRYLEHARVRHSSGKTERIS